MAQSTQPIFDEELTKEIGKRIFDKSQTASGKSFFSKDFWYGRIMEWSMKNESFKTQMFRFVDVLPYLNSSQEVAKHLKEYFAEGGEQLPSVFNVGVGLGSLAPGLMAGAIRKNVTEMAKMFITGENPKEALTVIKKARKRQIGFTVDLLGEATLSEKEALDYQKRYLELIDWIAKDASSWKDIPQIDNNHEGAIPKVNVSVKLTSIYSQIKVTAWQKSIEILKERFRPILRSAIEKNVFINVDMEHFEVKDMTIEVFKQILMEDEFKNYRHFGIVVQAYLRDSLEDVKSLIQFSKERGTPFTVRLVKGAYWDAETIHAQQDGWPYPVYTNKQESDANYEVCAQEILCHHDLVRLAIGSHNVRSIAACLAMAKKLNVPENAIEIQMLYGMADMFKDALVSLGYRVREYSPVGELIPGMAYLVRRLLENTSNESFLRSKFAEDVSIETLLKDPKADLQPTSDKIETPIGHFQNEPLLDFTIPEVREKMTKTLEKFPENFSREYEIHIDGKNYKTSKTLDSINPSKKDEIVGKVFVAGIEETEKAIQAAKSSYQFWKKTPALERARLVDNLADVILSRRYELMALEVFEAGKSWSEADGDITEAIDFCRYYANDMRNLSQPKRIGWVPGELNHYLYTPRGVTAVIAPWNFPLAILTGMAAAAAVTGNTVIMKPAEQTSITAAWLMDMVQEAGFPDGVINFLPGYGEEIGSHLVDHKDVAFIAFTGSKSVGLNILGRVGQVLPGQPQLKKCVLEMGGKNAVIVDSDADLDEAVHEILYSAFGFQGQKCSAASRAIVLKDNYDRFIERLVDAASSIKVLESLNPDSYMGPVIDEEAYNNILSMIETGKKEATLAFQGEVPATGFFVPPTIFKEVDPKAQISQKEIFGPVLSVIKVDTIEEAVEVANDTEYALTGGLFSRSPANIEYIKENYLVGNLYINRSITGAMVDRHPFGGFRMSGIGSKTGGPGYLTQFMDPRCISENTMRRGFAPEETKEEV